MKQRPIDMSVNEPINNLANIEEAQDVSYVYPKSEEIVIHKSDLQIQLEEFKKKILSTFSVYDMIAIVSLWSPIFSADFKTIMNITAAELKAGYIMFATLVTLFILGSRAKYQIVNLFQKRNVSSNSKDMAENILAKCNSKEKK